MEPCRQDDEMWIRIYLNRYSWTSQNCWYLTVTDLHTQKFHRFKKDILNWLLIYKLLQKRSQWDRGLHWSMPKYLFSVLTADCIFQIWSHLCIYPIPRFSYNVTDTPSTKKWVQYSLPALKSVWELMSAPANEWNVLHD